MLQSELQNLHRLNYCPWPCCQIQCTLMTVYLDVRLEVTGSLSFLTQLTVWLQVQVFLAPSTQLWNPTLFGGSNDFSLHIGLMASTAMGVSKSSGVRSISHWPMRSVREISPSALSLDFFRTEAELGEHHILLVLLFAHLVNVIKMASTCTCRWSSFSLLTSS